MISQGRETTKSKDFELFALDSAIILTIISAFSYITTFTYEDSFCGQFGIPSEYISIDLSTILPFGTKMLFGTFLIIFIINIFSSLKLDYLKRNIRLKLYVKNNLISLLTYLIITFTILSSFSYKFYLFLILMFITNLSSFFVVRTKAWQIKNIIDSNNPKTTTHYEYKKAFYILIISISIAFVVFCDVKGKADAKTQTKFYVMTNSPEKVVIRKYGDYFIFLQYNYKSNRFTKDISVYKLANQKKLTCN